MITQSRASDIAHEIARRTVHPSAFATCWSYDATTDHPDYPEGYWRVCMASHEVETNWDFRMPLSAAETEETLRQEIETQFAIQRLLQSAGLPVGW